MFENESVSIGKTAKMLGCSVVTLRRWEKLGKLTSIFRTFGNHRRYNIHDINKILNKNKQKTICDSRVSSHDQKKDLIVQNKKLIQFAQENKYQNIEPIMDLGSGLNYKKKGLTVKNISEEGLELLSYFIIATGALLTKKEYK